MFEEDSYKRNPIVGSFCHSVEKRLILRETDKLQPIGALAMLAVCVRAADGFC